MSLPSQLCFGQTQGSIRWAALPNKRRQAPHEAGISCNSGGHLGFAKLSHFWGEGWVKQIHCPHELKSCVIFTYCGLKYNYFYNLSKSLGNYWPKYWDKKNWNSFVKYILSLPPSSSSPFTDHYFDPIARLPSLCSAPKEKDTYCVVFIRWFRFSLIEKRIHQSKELEN